MAQRSRPRGPTAVRHHRAGTRMAEVHDALLAAYHAYESALPVTLRQLYYKAIGLGLLDKSLTTYHCCIDVSGEMRRSGEIPWWTIRDNVTSVLKADDGFDDFDHFVDTYTPDPEIYTERLLNDQPTYLEVFCESGGMAPQLARIAHQFGIWVSGSGGYDKLGSKMQLIQRLRRESARRPCVILQLGDGDEFGRYIYGALKEEVGAWCDAETDGGLCADNYFTDDADIGLRDSAWQHSIDWVRVAVLPEHIATYHLETRWEDAALPLEEQRVELEAMAPADIDNLLYSAICDYWDDGVSLETQERISRIQEEIREWLATNR